MKISLKKKLIIILLLVLLSIIAIFLYKNMKEDHNLTIIKANEIEESNLEKLEKYTLNFDLRGGTNGPDTIESSSPNGMLPDVYPEKTGYYFAGWAKKSEPYTVWRRPNQSYDIDYEFAKKDKDDDTSVTLIAVWKCKVKFSTGDRNVYEDLSEGNRQMSSEVPEKDGCKFLGWGLESDRYQVWCRAGDNYNLDTIPKVNFKDLSNSDANLTLYAVWARKIKFDPRGGKYGNSETLFYEGEDNYMSPDLGAPTKIGCKFLGWSIKSKPYQVWCNVGEKYNLNTLSTEDFNADGTVTLAAIWERKINLISNVLPWEEFATINVTEGENHTMISQEPTRTGFKFEGWATKSNNRNQVWCKAGGEFNLSRLSEKDINDDGTINLYAVWKRVVILNTGERNIEILIDEDKCHDVSFEEPKKVGFKFEGWATKSNPNQVWCEAGKNCNLNTLSEEDINDDGTIPLFAVWKEDTNPTNPDEGNTDPTNPDEGNTDPTDPDEGNTDPTDPDEGNTKPTNPDEGNTNPTNPDKDNTNPDKNNTNPTNPNKSNIDKTTSNKNNTNTNQLNTAPMPLSYTGNETNYEKIVIIGILVCTTTAIVLYFKLRNANY